LRHTKRTEWYDGSGGTLELWPDVMLDQWATDMRPSTTASPSGAWADITLEPTAVRVNLNARFDSVLVTLPGSVDCIDWGDGGGVARVVTAEPTDDDGGLVGDAVPIGGVAAGFYQTGESEFLLTEDLAGSSGSLPMWVRIEAFVPAVGEVVTQVCQVNAITSQALSSGATAYRYTIEQGTAYIWDHPDADPIYDIASGLAPRTYPESFCDFPYLAPDERASIRPLLMTGESADLPGTIHDILQSKYGDGVRGASDVLTDGVGLTDAQLDPETFTRATTPPGLDQTAFVFDGDESVGDIIGPMLRAAGYSLTPRLSLADGLRRLSLVPMRRASVVQSRLGLTRDDFISEPSIESITDDEIVNRIVYQAPGRDSVRVEFRDVDSIGRNGERKTQTEELIGFTPSGDTIGQATSTMQPIALARFALVGTPRRILRGTIRLGLGVLIDCGDVVTLTHSDAVGYTGARGLSSAPAVVVSRRLNFEDATAQVELAYHGANLSGFAPSLVVSSVVSATVVEVTANAHTEAADPVDGEAQEDLSYWTAGDVALMVSDPLGAGWPTGYERTVDSVDLALNRIEFTAAHGLSVGDYIRPASYASASSSHQAYAYLSDGDEIDAGVPTLEHD
jgi:hypothetical protein